MIIDSQKNFYERVKEFNKIMIETAKDNNKVFNFEDIQYTVSSDGVFVQTLINDRILYRIFMDERRNDLSVNYRLLECLEN